MPLFPEPAKWCPSSTCQCQSIDRLFEKDLNTKVKLYNTYVWVHNRSNMPMFCLKKKTSFSALGGPEVAIFRRDNLVPLYFDVSNF